MSERPPPAPPRKTVFRRTTSRLALGLGLTLDRRRATVTEMFETSGRRAPAYWLQLVISTGLATLGLVLGSAAVVIGAMLISPLMGSIVGLGMGLAVASPVLVVRASVRVAASIAVVVLLATIGAHELPFHEVTHEIGSRTSPNALDLLVAMLCAVAAVHTTVRGERDAASAAAGTAIGIALVPPLCVVGYGLGTGEISIARGAGLLFTANLCAILLIAVVSFMLLGFGEIDVAAREQEELASARRSVLRPIARALHRAMSHRYGRGLRLLLPLAFVAAVFVPLRSALAMLAWEVRVRSGVDAIVARLPAETVRSTLSLDGHEVSLRLLVVGSQADAQRLQADLARDITRVAGGKPNITVAAVPDLRTMQAVAASLATPVPIAKAPEKPDVAAARAAVWRALVKRWPDAAGTLVTARLELGSKEAADLRVVHIGGPLRSSDAQSLASALSAELGIALRVVDDPYAPEASESSTRDVAPWLRETLVTLARLRAEPDLFACIRAPGGATRANKAETLRALADLRAALPSARGAIDTNGDAWRLEVRARPCEDGEDAGARDAATDGPALSVDISHDAAP